MSNELAALIVIAIVILAIVFGPFILIWSISTLWGVPAVYTFKTWLAAEIFVLWLKPSITTK